MFEVLILFAAIQVISGYPSENVSVELSFKRLESGESSGEVVNQCCERESKYVTLGHGISEGEVRIDVGHCRQKCVIPVVEPLKREEFDKYLKKFPDMDPIQIFLSLQRMSSLSGESSTASGESNNHESNDHHHNRNRPERMSTSCLQSVCLPSAMKRETFYDLSGEVKEFDVIETCDCSNLPQEGCQRISSRVKIHTGTPYEMEVDVGQCLGSCDDDSAEHCLSCRPVRNRTISVEGPSGAYCEAKIEECQCVGECYRVRKFLKVFDYAHIFEATVPPMSNETIINIISGTDRNNNNNINESLSSSNESPLEPLTKVIDIGRCSGSCSDVPVASKCLLWSSPNNGTCLSALSGGRSKCTATKFVSHSYTDKHGKKHTVVSVTGCGCR